MWAVVATTGVKSSASHSGQRVRSKLEAYHGLWAVDLSRATVFIQPPGTAGAARSQNSGINCRFAVVLADNSSCSSPVPSVLSDPCNGLSQAVSIDEPSVVIWAEADSRVQVEPGRIIAAMLPSSTFKAIRVPQPVALIAWGNGSRGPSLTLPSPGVCGGLRGLRHHHLCRGSLRRRS